MGKYLGVNTGKGYSDQLACIASRDVPIGSIMLVYTTTRPKMLTKSAKTYYCTVGGYSPSYCAYESLDDVTDNSNGTLMTIDGVFLCLGSWIAQTTEPIRFYTIVQKVAEIK